MVDEQLLKKNDRILEEMVRRLVTAFHPDHIYLYGSRATYCSETYQKIRQLR